MNNKKIIIITITVFLIVSASILLGIIISNNSKPAKEKLKKYTCGKDGDNLAIAMCDRYEEKGYIVTFKNGYDLNDRYKAVNTLLDKIPGLPVIYFEGDEMDVILRTHFNTPEKGYKMDDVLYIIDYGKIDFSKIEKAVKEIECLDKIYNYTGIKDSSKEEK